jgi:TPR repeat protein
VLAHASHAGAVDNLELCYDNDIGVEQNAAKAVELVSRATSTVHAGIMLNLGNLSFNGDGVEVDEANQL